MPIRAEYVHTNLIARDWKRLARFYSEVFECEPKAPERDMSGAWLDQLTSLHNAHLSGVHLRLPGYSDDGPMLEIVSYNQLVEPQLSPANQCGFGHIAFAVDDVNEALQQMGLVEGHFRPQFLFLAGEDPAPEVVIASAVLSFHG